MLTLKTRGWACELNFTRSTAIRKPYGPMKNHPQILFSAKGLQNLAYPEKKIFPSVDHFVIVLFALLARKLTVKCVAQF